MNASVHSYFSVIKIRMGVISSAHWTILLYRPLYEFRGNWRQARLLTQARNLLSFLPSTVGSLPCIALNDKAGKILKNAIFWNKNDKLNRNLRPFLAIFCQLYVDPSQKWGSDSVFEGLNRSETYLDLKCQYFHLHFLCHFAKKTHLTRCLQLINTDSQGIFCNFHLSTAYF